MVTTARLRRSEGAAARGLPAYRRGSGVPQRQEQQQRQNQKQQHRRKRQQRQQELELRRQNQLHRRVVPWGFRVPHAGCREGALVGNGLEIHARSTGSSNRNMRLLRQPQQQQTPEDLGVFSERYGRGDVDPLLRCF